MVVLWIGLAGLGLIAATVSLVVIGRSQYYLSQDIAILLLGVALFIGSTILLSSALHQEKQQINKQVRTSTVVVWQFQRTIQT